MSIFSANRFDDFALRQAGSDLPPRLRGAGTLQMSFSSRRTQARVGQCLARMEIAHDFNGNRVSVRTGDLTTLIFQLAGALSWVEQSAVQTSFHPDGLRPQPSDLFGSCSLRSFMAKVQCRWLTELLREGHLHSVFQPIMSCAAGEGVYGYEALMRCDDGGRAVSPLEVIDIARGADLLPQLDRQACRNAVLEAARFKIPTKLFVNVTPEAVCNSEGRVDAAVGFLHEIGLHARQIVLELVESEEVSDWHHLRRIVELYRSRGFEIALDDFGSGYSSLTTFNRLRPDYIKIDMDMIRSVHLDAHKATLAGKLIEAARELGIKTIAEGVESAGEYKWVRGRGVDFVQGFYISRPAAPPPFAQTA